MTIHHLPPIPEEPELVRARPIAWTFVATILAVLAAAVVVWALDAFQLAGGGRSDVLVDRRPLVPPAQPFTTPLPTDAERAAQRAALDGWTWADAAHTRVRVPVAVAIDRYLGRYLGGAK
jgi:hypothetical protein